MPISVKTILEAYLEGATGPAGPSNVLNSTDVTSGATGYIVFVADTGNQTPNIRKTTQALAYSPGDMLIYTSGIQSQRYITDAGMIVTEAGTSRTLGAADNGKIIMCTSNSAVTITVPTGLSVGFSVTVMQAGTGQVSFSASSTTINNRQSHTKTAGQWAVVSLIQRTTNNFVLAGDTTT